MPVTLTEKAAKHVANFIAKRGKGVGLRLGVRTTECSGMAYKLEFADSVNPDDTLFESHGVTVIVDPKSLPKLDPSHDDAPPAPAGTNFHVGNHGTGAQEP